jgi:hypothetical protein
MNSASYEQGNDICDEHGTRAIWNGTTLLGSCSTSNSPKLSLGILFEEYDIYLPVRFSYFFYL